MYSTYASLDRFPRSPLLVRGFLAERRRILDIHEFAATESIFEYL
jgi:hypothetical protein